MVTIPTTDLNRMTLAIEQEVQARIKELRVETIQLYNSLKGEYIKAGIRKANESRMQKARKAREGRAQTEGALRNVFRKRVEAVRCLKIQETMVKVANTLRGCPMSSVLLEQCISRMGTSMLKDCYIFCMERDAELVRAFLTKRFGDASFDIRTLPEVALGGVILLKKQGGRPVITRSKQD